MSPEFSAGKENRVADVSEMERVLSGLYRLKANGNRHLNEQVGIEYCSANDLANEAFSSIALAVLLGKFENANIGLTIELIVADYLKRSDITEIKIEDLYRISPNGNEIKKLHAMFEGNSAEAEFARNLISYNKGLINGEWENERIDSLKKLNVLKKLERTGWIERVKKGYRETVGEHIFGTVVMGLFFGSGDLDDEDHKLPVMMTIHDMGECIVGDIMPDEPRAKDKHKVEKKAMKYLFKNDPFILSCFDEYEDKESKLGKKAKRRDKTECLFQTNNYEKTYNNNTEIFDDFWFGGKNSYGDLDFGDLQFFIDFLKKENSIENRKRNYRTDII